jgi:ATP-binding cassette subfamily B protein
VLLIRKGELAAQGTHDELLAQSRLYRRIFAHYDESEPGTSEVAGRVDANVSVAGGED